ncbi:UbiA family prenyltransferase [Streptomyces malaysiensis subsp. malaysiensis]|uniref:UbiA family prenyltransferase n=1 Tax=Streptomyces malaysiensis TaxID=92644 RepID=A0ABX6WJ43_STRMQ|nr:MULTISPECIES: UbiA family prenyltransferase [Streptomyces]QPI60604.1 UbiA family prenyltransferase [Streptomyces solisilvae]UHH22321.1 UbiA family prenyltransferase [Streptomyces sp. HNM0561]
MAELSDVLTASRVPARLGRFVLRMFRPQIYVTYGVLWTLALEGSAEALSGSAAHWTPSWSTVARAVSVVLALLFARMVDEQKDLEYDRTHNPDRPLVTGAITAAELRGAMAFSTVVVVVLNTFVSAFSVLLILLALGYTLFLVALERRFPRFGERLIANLLVSYPVQLLLSGYLYVSLLTGDEIGGDGRAAPLMAMFACVFLQFEFARKTEWRRDPRARLYSEVLGPRGSAAVSLALAVGAVALGLLLFGARGWPPALSIVFPALGAWRFLVRRKPSGLMLPAMGFVLFFNLLCFYGSTAIAIGR